MPLELDSRQRAMLQEMGVHVWLPETAFAPPAELPQPEAAASAPMPASADYDDDEAYSYDEEYDNDPSLGYASAPRAPEPKSQASPSATAPVRAPVAPPTARPAAPAIVAVDNAELAQADWAGLAATAAQCSACGLCAGRKNSTLCAPAFAGVGSLAAPLAARADWMFVGDPPDEDEDREASPFAQAAGTLMGNMLKACRLSRVGQAQDAALDAQAEGGQAAKAEQLAYLTNVVKCRPPHSQIPQAADLAQCAAYLNRELALVQPKVIVAMGRFAMQLLLSEQPGLATQPLGKLRGTVYRYRGVPVVVTYHPKALLRNSPDKAKAWADLCLAMGTVDGSLQ